MRAKHVRPCVAMAIVFVLLSALCPVVNADYLTEWSGTVPVLGVRVNAYPGFVAGQACVAQANIVYCVGGLNGTAHATNMVYAASVSGLGVGQWERLSDYPTAVSGQSCILSSGYIYCIGGLEGGAAGNSTPEVTSASYFAPLTALNVGKWTRTTDYPFGVFDQSCAVSSNYVYCVGGVTSNSTNVSAVEYAQLSPSGIAGWKPVSPYPSGIAAESCAAYSKYLYCVGGLNATSRATASVYYTSLAGSDLSWAMATGYPNPVAGHSCVIHYPGLYCIGGLNATAYATKAVFFSYLNSTHLNWIASVFYPVNVQSQSCVTYSSYIYCIGGYDGLSFLKSVYFSTIGPLPGNTTVSLSTTSTASNSSVGANGSSTPGATNYELPTAVAAGAALVIVIAALASRVRLSKNEHGKREPSGD